jgi:adhesin transport system outer membrane protein
MGNLPPAVLIYACLAATGSATAAEPFSITSPIRMAVETNPRVGQAAANKRATQAELHQNQGTLLP